MAMENGSVVTCVTSGRDLRSIFCSRRFDNAVGHGRLVALCDGEELGALAARLKQACCMDDHSKVVPA